MSAHSDAHRSRLFIGKDLTGRKTHFGEQVAQPKFTLEARFFRATVRPSLQ
jgi:hypothetical protein